MRTTEEFKETNEPSQEVVAAISLALAEAMCAVHDRESGVITIKRINAPFSPWGMKAHNQREVVRRTAPKTDFQK